MFGRPLILDEYVPYRLALASSAVSGLIATTYQNHFGLKVAEWRLIAILYEDGPSKQQDLVPRTGMDKVTVSRTAQTLFKKRLIRRSPHQHDGRSHLLELTPAGRDMYRAIAPTAKTCELSLLEVLQPSEVALLRDFLVRLEANAKKTLGDLPK